MTDNDRILCQVLEQQLSLRLREGCRDVLLHLLPAPLRGCYIALRSSAAGYARMWAGTRKMEYRRQQPRKGRSPAAGRGFVRQAGLMTASNMSGPHFTKPRICR